jgi:hypothetical protein
MAAVRGRKGRGVADALLIPAGTQADYLSAPGG